MLGLVVTGYRMSGSKAELRRVSVAITVAAQPQRVFDVLADVTRHVEFDGSGTVIGRPRGPRRLGLGSEFTMGMRQGPRRYRSFNRVVEFDEGRRIAWESMGLWRGHKVIGGQRWRYLLTPTDTGTVVTHSYVWGYATMPLLTVWLPRYPMRSRAGMRRSLQKLAQLVT